MRVKPTPSYYAIIPAEVRYDTKLSANQKLLYGEITSLCNKEGYCWANNNYFAELYNVDARTIRRWVTGLKNRGYVDVTIEYVPNTKQVDKRIIKLCNSNISIPP